MMDTSTFTDLSRALDLGSARLQAISNNISNVNTPGFKRQDATFAALLEDASSGDVLPQETADPRHLTFAGDPGSQSAGPVLITPDDGTMRKDGSNVDIDAETSRLTAAEIYYNGVAQLMSGQFAAMKYVIAGGH